MKVSKYLVLCAGILGLLWCFVPDASSNTGHAMVFELVRARDLQWITEEVVAMNLTLLAPFISIVFCLLGVIGIGRQRFGRVAGMFAILAGLVDFALIALRLQTPELQLAVLLLIAIAGVGAFGGLMALLSPERLAITRFPRPTA